MSDYEDEMDVDAPAAQSSIQFSSNSNEKGKRSAANLPVELQDTLPWYVLPCYHQSQSLTAIQG
jgi:replication factor C subunit 3/5